MVVARAPFLRRRAPFRRHPTLNQHPLQRRIQRPFFHAQHVRGNLLYELCDFKSVHLAVACQRPQDQQVQRPGGNLVSIQGGLLT